MNQPIAGWKPTTYGHIFIKVVGFQPPLSLDSVVAVHTKTCARDHRKVKCGEALW